MDLTLSSELRKKFIRFREIYELTLAKLKDEGVSGYVVAKETYAAALCEIPLSNEELRLYKMHVALHSVNGGELFSADMETE